MHLEGVQQQRALPTETGNTEMTKLERTDIIAKIDTATDYDAATIRFHHDGTISALKDADKTYGGADGTRYLVGRVSDYAA